MVKIGLERGNQRAEPFCRTGSGVPVLLESLGPKNVRFSDSTGSVLLDAIRGVAAFLVLLEHWRNAYFVDFSQIQSHRTLLSVVYTVCAAGHQAVIVFFVLSGYLISGSVIRALGRNTWSWRQYLIHRLVRLWIVLLPALILGGMWDLLGIRSHQAPAMYSGADYNHITPDVQYALSIEGFVGNLAFLQTIIVPPFGSNGALWSLANEFWYYVLFPLAACVAGRIYKRSAQVLVCGLVFCSLAAFVGKNIIVLLPVWLLGTLLHGIPSRQTTTRFRSFTCIVYTVVFFGIAILDRKWRKMPPVASDLALGIATAGFVWVLLGAVSEARHTLACRLSRLTARFSFTLYVAHTPVLVFLVALMAHDSRWLPAVHSGGLALGALALVVGYAWLLATATEFRTDRVRVWVEGKVLRLPKKAMQ